VSLLCWMRYRKPPVQALFLIVPYNYMIALTGVSVEQSIRSRESAGKNNEHTFWKSSSWHQSERRPRFHCEALCTACDISTGRHDWQEQGTASLCRLQSEPSIFFYRTTSLRNWLICCVTPATLFFSSCSQRRTPFPATHLGRSKLLCWASSK
jgi:hypothetical protein